MVSSIDDRSDSEMNEYDWDAHGKRVLEGFDDRQRAIYDALEQRDFEPFASSVEPGQSPEQDAIAFLSQRFMGLTKNYVGAIAHHETAKQYIERSNRARARFGAELEAVPPEYDDAVFQDRRRALVACGQAELDGLCASLGLPPYSEVDLEDEGEVKRAISEEGLGFLQGMARQVDSRGKAMSGGVGDKGKRGE